MNILLALALFSFPAFAALPADAEIDKVVLGETARLKGFCNNGVCPRTKNIAVGIIDKDGYKIRYYLDGKPDPNPPKAAYPVTSITQAFTAAILAELAAEGKVDLDQPAAKYLPPAKDGKPAALPTFNGAPFTVRHVLTHTAGLPRYPAPKPGESEASFHWRLRNAYSVHDAYADLKSINLSYAPGSQFQFSNLGYALLTALIAKAEGKSYEETLKNRVLGPLGMKSSGVRVPANNHATGHDENGKAIPEKSLWFVNESVMDGTGALKVTPDDFLRFLAAELGLSTFGAVPPALGKAMQATQEPHVFLQSSLRGGDDEAEIIPVTPSSAKDFLTLGKDDYVAMGWLANPAGKRWKQAGGILGFRSRVFLDRKKGPVAAFAFSNSDLKGERAVVTPIARELLKLYLR